MQCHATSLRNETWSGDRVFWEDAVAKAPQQGLPHLHLGLTYDRAEAKDEAEQKKLNEMAKKEYLTALDEKNVVYDIEGRSTAWNNIANVYMAEGDDAKALEAFLKAIEMRPDYPTPHYGLGLLHYHKGVAAQRAGDGPGAVRNMQVAREWLEKAIRLNERYVKAIFLNGVVLMSLRDPQASRSLSEVIRLIPGTSEAARAQELLDLMRAHPEDYSRGATVASVPGASEGNPRVVGGAAPKQPPGGGPRR